MDNKRLGYHTEEEDNDLIKSNSLVGSIKEQPEGDDGNNLIEDPQNKSNYNNIKLKNKFYREQSEVENNGVSFDSTDPVINENDKKLKVLRLKTTNI